MIDLYLDSPRRIWRWNQDIQHYRKGKKKGLLPVPVSPDRDGPGPGLGPERGGIRSEGQVVGRMRIRKVESCPLATGRFLAQRSEVTGAPFESASDRPDIAL